LTSHPYVGSSSLHILAPLPSMCFNIGTQAVHIVKDLDVSRPHSLGAQAATLEGAGFPPVGAGTSSSQEPLLAQQRQQQQQQAVAAAAAVAQHQQQHQRRGGE